MAIDQPAHVQLAGRGQPSEAEGNDEKVAVWAFLWTLFAFKIATVAAIAWAAKSFEAGVLLTATTWPFLIIPIAAGAGPGIFYLRLRRVRRRREQLRRAEWMLDG